MLIEIHENPSSDELVSFKIPKVVLEESFFIYTSIFETFDHKTISLTRIGDREYIATSSSWIQYANYLIADTDPLTGLESIKGSTASAMRRFAREILDKLSGRQ